MHREGGCACGAIRFTIDAPLLGTGACHCRNCQKFAGGGPNYVALVPKGVITITRGTPHEFHDSGDSGDKVIRAFCPDCGTPLWSVPEHKPFIPVKVGAFDDTADLAPQMHIYTASAPAWHAIPDNVPTFAQMAPAILAPPE